MPINSGIYYSIIFLYIVNFIMFLSFNNFLLTPYKIMIYLVKNIICLMGFFYVSNLNFNYIKNYSFYIYLICVGLLIFVHFLGVIGLGAKRWINLGIFYLQPSEFMKLCLPIHVCHYLSNNDPMNLKKIMKIFLISIIPIFFVIIEPDLGTGIILMTIIGGLLFIGGIKKKYIFTASFLFSVAFPIIWSRMYTYQKQRVVTFITGGDLKKEGYQIRQSRIAIGSGRALGKGFMQGTQFRFHFLPKPETDFIFSCICEEWGFIGAMVIMWIFLYLTIVSIATSLWKQVSYENYLCFAIGIYIFFSFFFNIAMTMSLLPTVGVPLPVLSRGGSSTATFLLALALLINIRKINYKNC